MFDRIIDFIIDALDLFRFWVVIDSYEKAVVLRLGKPVKVLSAGIHWIVPMGVDSVMTDSVVMTTMNLGSQTLQTSDDYNIVVSPIVTYQIVDIEKFLLGVEDAESVLSDTVYSFVAGSIISHEFEAILKTDFLSMVTDLANLKTRKFGIHILRITFADIAEIKTIRIIGDSQPVIIED
jgi:regulator of protease activity HflC (stomatin/prohibitin superfamily)